MTKIETTRTTTLLRILSNYKRYAVIFLLLVGAMLMIGDVALAQGNGGGNPPPQTTLGLTKTDSPDPVVVGQTLTYTLTVTNNSDRGTAAQIDVQDVLPNGVTFVSANASQGNCTRTGRTVNCDLGNLKSGDSATVTIKVTPTQPGTITNTAMANANNRLGATATERTTVRPAADLEIRKQGPANATNGQPFDYTLTVKNNGPNTARNVVVTDDLPDGFTFNGGASTDSCQLDASTQDPNDVRCTLANLGVNQSRTFTINATPTQTGDFTNVANVTSDTRDPQQGNNTARANTTVTPAADLAITKEKATSGPATFGEPFDYTITVTNNGPNVARDVVVNDDLPEALAYNDGASSPECDPVAGTPDPNDVRCTLGDLEPGQSRELTINVTPNRTGSVSNTATVDSSTNDPNRGNNSDTARNDIQGANLQVEKSDGTADGRVTAGSEFTYTITVTNNGPAIARDVTLADPLPNEVTFVSVEADRDTAGDPACNDPDPNRVVRCELGTLDPGETTEVRITVRAPNEGSENIFNRATARSQNDPNGDSDGERSTTATGSADLSLQKQAPAEVTDEEIFTYTLTVENAGPSTARDVMVEDELPAEVEFVSVTSNRDAGGTPACTEANGLVECDNLGDLAPNDGPITVEITVRAKTPTPPGENGARNEAEVSSAVSDPDRTNNRDQASTRINAEADLAITKTAPDTVTDGQPFDYTLTVENTGPSAAQDVTITDTLPANVEFVSAGNGCDYSEQSNTVTCELGALEEGGTAERKITVRATQPGESVNTANVETSTTDPNVDNDSNSATTQIQASADLSITKTDSEDPVAVGEQFTYTVEATNNGPSAAQNVQITDRLPDGVTPADPQNLLDGCTYDPQNNTITCDLGTLGSGESVVRQFDVTSDSEGQKTNEAEVTSDTPDPQQGNNTATENTTVRAEADLSITKTDDADPVTFGNELTYTLTIRNTGPNPAANVRVSDALPENVTFQSVSSNRDAPGDPSCQGPAQQNQPGGTVNCAFGQVGTTGDDPIEVTIVVKPTASAIGGQVLNTANVSSPTFDPNNDDRRASESTDVNAANVEINKKSNPESVRANQQFEYILTVTNTTGVDARDVTITDNLPPEVTFVAVDPATSADCTYNENDPARDDDNTVTCEPFDLAGNEEVQRRFTVQAPAQPPEDGTIRNSATVRTPNDPRPDRDTETDTFVGARADLALDKSAPETVTDEEVFAYDLTVTNNGPSAAAGVTIMDNLPTEVEFVPDGTDPRCEFDDNGTPGDASDDTVECSRTRDEGALSARDGQNTDTFTIQVRAKEQGATANNTATASSSTEDPEPGNNEGKAATLIQASADLSIDKEGPGTVDDEERFTYTLTVENTGPSTARNATVTDDLPDGVAFVSADSDQGTCAEPAQPDGVVECNLGNVTPAGGGNDPITITIRVRATEPGPKVNFATVESGTPDPDDGNNRSREVTTAVGAVADLRIEKRAPGTINDGQRFDYSLTVENNGPSTARGTQITDELPGGVRFISAPDCQNENGTVRCGVGNLAPGASAERTIRVEATSPGEKENTARASGDTNDPNGENNSDSVTTQVRAQADLTIDKRGPARVTDENRFTYTLVVKNNGPSNADGVRVVDNLPGGIRFLSASRGCNQRGGTVRCGSFDLAADASRQLKITVRAKQPGRKVNRASVSSPTGDPNARNNRDAVATVVRPKPTPSRSKSQACNPNRDGKTIFGTPGNDVLRGTRGNDRIFGFGGNDRIIGGNGEDQIIGGDGSDTIRGGPCGDTIKANDGNNRVYGEGGDDVMDGGKDRDLISGGGGADVFMGNGGRDRLIARDGREDTVNGGSGRDSCRTDRKDNTVGCP